MNKRCAEWINGIVPRSNSLSNVTNSIDCNAIYKDPGRIPATHQKLCECCQPSLLGRSFLSGRKAVDFHCPGVLSTSTPSCELGFFSLVTPLRQDLGETDTFYHSGSSRLAKVSDCPSEWTEFSFLRCEWTKGEIHVFGEGSGKSGNATAKTKKTAFGRWYHWRCQPWREKFQNCHLCSTVILSQDNGEEDSEWTLN